MAAYTVTKLIGAGQAYTTLATWEADAPANLTTAEKSACTTFLTGTFTVAMTLTFVGSGATGVVLETDSTGPGTGTYMVYGITTGNPAASDVITGTGGTPPTCVLTSGTADNVGVVWQGKINASTDGFSGTANLLTMAGSTASATSYKELTTKAGASFIDNIGAGALKYNESNGCFIKITSGSSIQTVVMTENYSRVSKVQTTNAGTYGALGFIVTGTGNQITQVISQLTAGSTGGRPIKLDVSTSTLLTNSLLIANVNVANVGLECSYSTTPEIDNCTIVRPSNITVQGTGIVRVGAATPLIKNCVVLGFTTPFTTSGFSASSSNNAAETGATFPGTGGGNVTAVNDTTTFTQPSAASAPNWRTPTGSVLIAAGSSGGNIPTTDILGTTVPAYAIGAFNTGLAVIANAPAGYFDSELNIKAWF